MFNQSAVCQKGLPEYFTVVFTTSDTCLCQTKQFMKILSQTDLEIYYIMIFTYVLQRLAPFAALLLVLKTLSLFYGFFNFETFKKLTFS